VVPQAADRELEPPAGAGKETATSGPYDNDGEEGDDDSGAMRQRKRPHLHSNSARAKRGSAGGKKATARRPRGKAAKAEGAAKSRRKALLEVAVFLFACSPPGLCGGEEGGRANERGWTESGGRGKATEQEEQMKEAWLAAITSDG